MDLSGWSDGGMNWGNPQPEKLIYTYALWQAIAERYQGCYRRLTLPPPQMKDVLSFSYLYSLRQALETLYNDYAFVDISKQPDMENGYNSWNGLSQYPHKMDSKNLQGLDFTLPPNASLINDVKTFYINMKTAISKLRYSQRWSYSNYFLCFQRSFKRGYASANSNPQDYHPISQGFENAENGAYTRTETESYYKCFVGKFVSEYSYTWTGYECDIQNMQLKVKGYFPQNFAPVGVLACYSFKWTDETYAVFGSDYQISSWWVSTYYKTKTSSVYWSGALGFTEGINIKPFGTLTNGTQYKIGDVNSSLPPNPPTPPVSETHDKNMTIIGSWNVYNLIFDWYTPTGFKFQS